MKKDNHMKFKSVLGVLLACFVLITGCVNIVSVENDENGTVPVARDLTDPQGMALLVGINSTDPAVWGSANEQGCYSCEYDVDNVVDYLRPLTYQMNTLKTSWATKSAITFHIYQASQTLEAGDIFVFYYSGHGSRQYDRSGDEDDRFDEGLCAYDGFLLDDTLNDLWVQFKPGVRIVMISDSCNSGTVYKDPLAFDTVVDGDNNTTQMQASLIHIGASRDDQDSWGGDKGSRFTNAMMEVLARETFNGNYKNLVEEINTVLEDIPQVAQYYEYGPVSDDFRNSAPFSIKLEK